MKFGAVGFAALLAAFELLGAPGHRAAAMPAGRGCSPAVEVAFAGTSDYLGSARLDADSVGAPWFVMSVKWDLAIFREWNTFDWTGSGWRPRGRSTFATGGPTVHVLSSQPTRRVVALGADGKQTLVPWLLMFSVAPDFVGQPDSVFSTTHQSTEWGGAESRSRRWAVRSDNVIDHLVNHIHTLYSDTAGIWHEVERLGVNEDHCTIAPLGDTTAMVVYAGQSGLQYAILDGSRWRESGNLDPRPFNAAHPRFRIRPSGGLWLFWESFDWMHMSCYRSGVWERGDSTQFLPNPTDHYQPAWFWVDHDTTERPVIVWNNLGYAFTYRDAAVIAFPNDHGWDPPEEIPDGERVAFVEPSVARDVNDDVWVTWWRGDSGITRWSHTYCTATCAAPAVTAQGDDIRVSWALSTPVRGSRWTVERALGDGTFDSLATVRAGADSVLAWDDATAAPGQTWRYRIRRESVDTAYLWWSEPTSHWRPDTRLALSLAAPAVTGAQLAFRVSGGAGTLTARLYDLQGRLALEHSFVATGTGDDSVTLDLGRPGAGHPGVYFLRVTDGTGRTSRTARLGFLR